MDSPSLSLSKFFNQSSTVRTLYQSFLDLLFPPACLLCRHALLKHGICDACSGGFEVLRPPSCTICGSTFATDAGENHPCGRCIKKKPPFDVAASLYLYKGDLSRAVWLLKYSKKSLLGSHLGGLMKNHRLNAISYDVIIAVPLHISRLRERGFNQSQLLAEGLGKGMSLDVDKYILERVRPTGSQAGMSSRERQANVRGAFSLRSGVDLSGKRILLIDDVYTTGATVKECSAVLKKAGAAVVNVLTLARVVEKNA